MSTKSSKKKEGLWQEAKINRAGLTQWFWRVLHKENFKLGKNSQIGSFTVIDAKEGVEIQDNVKIGFGCAILSCSSIDKKAGKVTLRANCKIGAHAVIMPGVTVGENAIVGALSFINRDIPANEVWVGSPARFLRRV